MKEHYKGGRAYGHGARLAACLIMLGLLPKQSGADILKNNGHIPEPVQQNKLRLKKGGYYQDDMSGEVWRRYWVSTDKPRVVGPRMEKMTKENLNKEKMEAEKHRPPLEKILEEINQATTPGDIRRIARQAYPNGISAGGEYAHAVQEAVMKQRDIVRYYQIGAPSYP